MIQRGGKCGESAILNLKQWVSLPLRHYFVYAKLPSNKQVKMLQ